MVCLPQAFLCFWKVSAVIVLFSVAKIWDTYVVWSIPVSGLLRKKKRCPSLEVWQEVPVFSWRISAFPELAKLQVSENLLVALAQDDHGCRCSLMWLMLIEVVS